MDAVRNTRGILLATSADVARVPRPLGRWEDLENKIRLSYKFYEVRRPSAPPPSPAEAVRVWSRQPSDIWPLRWGKTRRRPKA